MPVAQRRSARPPLDGQCIEVQQSRGVQVFVGKCGTEIFAPVDCSKRVDHGRAIDDDHTRGWEVGCSSRSPRAAAITSAAQAFARSARCAALSSTSATVGRAVSRSMRSSRKALSDWPRAAARAFNPRLASSGTSLICSNELTMHIISTYIRHVSQRWQRSARPAASPRGPTPTG